MSGWIGVDLDGTLAEYHGWNGGSIGEPIAPMALRCVAWLNAGTEVRVMTARVAPLGRSPEDVAEQREAIERWTEQHLGVRLSVTHEKDFGMIELWDDRAVRVRANTGEPCCGDHARG